MLVQLIDVPAALAGLGAALAEAGHRVLGEPGNPGDTEPASDPAGQADVLVVGLREGRGDEETLLNATWAVYQALVATPARGVVLLTSTRLYDGYHLGWRLSEDWAPRPTAEMGSLGPYLAELTARELSREGGLRVWAVRLDEIPERLAEPDALAAVTQAVARLGALDGAPATSAEGSFRTINVSGDLGRFATGDTGQRRPYAWTPQHPTETRALAVRPDWPTVAPVELSEPARRVTVYGAGGPMGVAVCRDLIARPGMLVTATDVRPLAEIAARPPQSPGAPLPESLPEPHREVTVDIADYPQVLEAARGSDCLVNVAVIRDDPALAFRVNTLGAWNVIRAAVELGIPRVVQTGPTMVLGGDPVGLAYDREVPADAPPRPGRWTYALTKLLGLEACRVWAEAYGVACPQLLFNQLLPDEPDGRPVLSYAVTWRDAGLAVAQATQVGDWPEPSVRLDVTVPTPQGRTQWRRVWELLGVEPYDRQDHRWYVNPAARD